jgi:hypothetical protein
VRNDAVQTHLVRSGLALGVLAASLMLTFCDRLVDPPLPSDAEQFSPPAVYSQWWNMTQACSEKSGSLSSVSWYKTDEALHDPRNGEELSGYWSSASNRIVLKSTAMLDGSVVRHEMLHALLQAGSHPRTEFLGKCAGTVACAGGCITEAGPYPPPPETPIEIGQDLLDLTVGIEPRSPAASSSRFFSVTVFAHNRSTHWAKAAPLLDPNDTLLTFGYELRGAGIGGSTVDGIARDPSDRIFAPGESKRMVFDFMIGDAAFGQQILPGDYTVRGRFSEYSSGDSVLVLGP